MADTLPEWADEWDGRKHCKKCKARLVVCYGFGGRHDRICSRSGWNAMRRNAMSKPSVGRYAEDSKRRIEAGRDNGITEDLGNGMSRRIEFDVGYDHRDFSIDCGGGGHGQHGMSMSFILLGPNGATRWEINMSEWTPRLVNQMGNLPALYPKLDAIRSHAVSIHAKIPQLGGKEKSNCVYLPEGYCYDDLTYLAAGPILEKFVNFGPHAVWSELVRWYNEIKGE